MNIAVDLNGGDYSPKEVIEGIKLALKRGYVEPSEILAYGDEMAIKQLKAQTDDAIRKINYRLCLETISMGDKITAGDRRRDSSISQGLISVRSNESAVFVSAGNTAAIVSLSVMILGRIQRGVSPAIAVVLPSKTGHCLVIDVGAQANAEADDLLHNAIMGRAYAREILGLKSPRIGLLNIGEEIGKGHKDIHQAYDLLKRSGLDFIGYVEGNDIFKGTVEVAVVDGFTGNILLKASEGLAKMILDLVKWELKNNKLFYLALPFLFCTLPFLYPILSSLKTKLDYEEYGGALLLGINGNVIISHGHAKRRTIAKAIRAAKKEAQMDIVHLLSQELTGYKKRPEA